MNKIKQPCKLLNLCASDRSVGGKDFNIFVFWCPSFFLSFFYVVKEKNGLYIWRVTEKFCEFVQFVFSDCTDFLFIGQTWCLVYRILY